MEVVMVVMLKVMVKVEVLMGIDGDVPVGDNGGNGSLNVPENHIRYWKVADKWVLFAKHAHHGEFAANKGVVIDGDRHACLVVCH